LCSGGISDFVTAMGDYAGNRSGGGAGGRDQPNGDDDASGDSGGAGFWVDGVGDEADLGANGAGESTGVIMGVAGERGRS